MSEPLSVVVVESPSKAKTIHKYLGRGFVVLASFGHVRDLPPKNGSVRPDEDFAMDWTTDPKSEKHVKEIVAALKGAQKLFLATDPDREGEAISWHVLEELRRRRALDAIDVKRVTFNAVTRAAVLEAVANPRDLDRPLIDAYLARRALDYLVGFTLSPVLWRKLPGARSAGRVQSVALRLICEREAEIERFKTEEYWTIAADMLSAGNKPFTARLTHLNEKKLEKFSLSDQALALNAKEILEKALYRIGSIERKQVKRHPAPPFTTSTLQQEAARKLYFSATKTMATAQRLYEGIPIKGEAVGLITYMRTDAVQMAPEALNDVRALIGQTWGDKYRPAAPRLYKTKQKNAQEAHEAIRPTNFFLKPADIRDALDSEQFKLYELIWKRAVASQMESAVLDQIGIDVVADDRSAILRASGSTVQFDGFLTLYREGDEDDAAGENDGGDALLPPLKEGEAATLAAVRPEQHFTQPPPRYSEAGLVKRLEELGIGRPSTYASILQVLQDRNYVKFEARRFVPEDRGRIVTAFLEGFFRRYVEYTFTADLENQLDEISGGRLDWKQVLRAFWTDFIEAVEGTQSLRITEVLATLDQDLAPHLFPARDDGSDPRVCPTCGEGTLSLKLSKFGAFIGCSKYPNCRYARTLGGGENGVSGEEAQDVALGTDPETNMDVALKKGPYGWYCQLGQAEGKTKPKRVGLPKGVDPASIDLAKALKLLSLPRLVGMHPETKTQILAGIGRFGPYLKHGDRYVTLRDDDVLEIGINRAVDLLSASPARRERASGTLLGPHPKDGAPVVLHDGRYGPYVAHGKINATLPKDTEASALTLDQAVELLAAKERKKGGKSTASSKTAPPKKAVKAKTKKSAGKKKSA